MRGVDRGRKPEGRVTECVSWARATEGCELPGGPGKQGTATLRTRVCVSPDHSLNPGEEEVSLSLTASPGGSWSRPSMRAAGVMQRELRENERKSPATLQTSTQGRTRAQRSSVEMPP